MDRDDICRRFRSNFTKVERPHEIPYVLRGLLFGCSRPGLGVVSLIGSTNVNIQWLRALPSSSIV
jgi:hypothetical protein